MTIIKKLAQALAETDVERDYSWDYQPQAVDLIETLEEFGLQITEIAPAAPIRPLSPTKENIRMLYTRTCQDSGFLLDWITASQITAKVINIEPLEIWAAFSSRAAMVDIAKGTHPAVLDKQEKSSHTDSSNKETEKMEYQVYIGNKLRKFSTITAIEQTLKGQTTEADRNAIIDASRQGDPLHIEINPFEAEMYSGEPDSRPGVILATSFSALRAEVNLLAEEI